MNNAEKFKETFGIYATEMWAMPESEFLSWLNSLHDVNATNTTDTISRQDALDALEWKWAGKAAIDAIKALPSAERTVAHIQDFTKYQIDWLTAHCDLELEPELESWVIRFLEDTATCYDKEYLSSAERVGHWIQISPAKIYECSECGQNVMTDDIECYKYCHGCGAEMEGSE